MIWKCCAMYNENSGVKMSNVSSERPSTQTRQNSQPGITTQWNSDWNIKHITLAKRTINQLERRSHWTYYFNLIFYSLSDEEPSLETLELHQPFRFASLHSSILLANRIYIFPSISLTCSLSYFGRHLTQSHPTWSNVFKTRFRNTGSWIRGKEIVLEWWNNEQM